MAKRKRQTPGIKWKNLGFLYLCRELRNDPQNFYKHRYTIRDRKFRPGQGGRNVPTDWGGLDEAIFKHEPNLSLPPLSCPLRPRHLTAEEREEAGRTAYLNWAAVKQQQAGGEPAGQPEVRPWEELTEREKDVFRKAGESLATPENMMWDMLGQIRKRMGEKAFRRNLFEVTLPVAIERMLPDVSEAERHYVTDYIVKLSRMLDVPDAAG